jgi:hypothetical protein
MLIKNLNVVDEMKNFNGMVDFNERAAGFIKIHHSIKVFHLINHIQIFN